MSVVVAKVKENSIEVAADSICVAGWSIIPASNAKVSKLFKHNGMIIGGCGLAEENSLFSHYIKTHTIDVMDEAHLLTFLKEFKDWKKEYNGDERIHNEYILAYKKKCYGIDNMYVFEIKDYYAIGAGQDFASGAMYMGASATDAVRAACLHSAMVCEPVVSEKIEWEN